jgi:hypothetical protein
MHEKHWLKKICGPEREELKRQPETTAQAVVNT